VLRHCLNGFDTDYTGYPKAEDESNIFLSGADVLVTVAGNQKFVHREKIEIDLPICNGLLGHRILIINKHDQAKFRKITALEQLRRLTVGVPATWADADLLRKNHFSVYENGSLEDILDLLPIHRVDFTALGANEVEACLQQHSASTDSLAIEDSILIYYPLPLIFYVNPNQPELAQQLRANLSKLINSGELNAIFNTYHVGIVERLALPTRNLLTLKNPYLPESLRNFRPALW